MTARTKSIIDRNYLGLKHGDYLGRNAGRNESYIFWIFKDGSHAVMVQDEKDINHTYIFGDLYHCKYIFLNSDTKQLQESFINVLKAV